MKTLLLIFCILHSAFCISADTNVTFTVTFTDAQWAAVTNLAKANAVTPHNVLATNTVFAVEQFRLAQEQADINDLAERYRTADAVKRAKILTESRR